MPAPCTRSFCAAPSPLGLAPRYVQVLLGAVSCTLLALIGYALWGPGTGLVAALCAALYGPAIYFTGALLPPVLAVFLVLLLLAALLWADRQSRWERHF